MFKTFKIFRVLEIVLIALGIVIFFGTYSASVVLADTPDRCFHKHYNNTTKCKVRIKGKKCTDASGNKGKCVQNSSSCYCKIYKKSGTNELIDLGLDVGISILKHKKHKKHHNKHSD